MEELIALQDLLDQMGIKVKFEKINLEDNDKKSIKQELSETKDKLNEYISKENERLKKIESSKLVYMKFVELMAKNLISEYLLWDNLCGLLNFKDTEFYDKLKDDILNEIA